MKAEVISLSLPNSTPKRPNQAVISKEMSSGQNNMKANAIEKPSKLHSTNDQSKSSRPGMETKLNNKLDQTNKKDTPLCKTKENKGNVNTDATRRENGNITRVAFDENTDFHYNLFDAYVERVGRATGNRKCLNDVTHSAPHSNTSSPFENGISSSSSTGREPIAIPLFDDKCLRNSLREASEMPSHILFMYPYRKQEDGGFFDAWCPPISTKNRLLLEEGTKKLLSKQQVHALQFSQPRFHRSLTMAPKEVNHSNISVYDRLLSLGRYKEYGFQHKPEDTGWYIKEYTAHHTVGRVGHRNRKSHKLGVDIPDPYAQLPKKSRSPFSNGVESWQTQPSNDHQKADVEETKENAKKVKADDGKSDKSRAFPVLAPVRENTQKKGLKRRSSKGGHKHGKASSEPSSTSKDRRESQAGSLGDSTIVGSHIDVATSAIFQDAAAAKTQSLAVKDQKEPATDKSSNKSLAQGRENTFWANPVQDHETSQDHHESTRNSVKHSDDSSSIDRTGTKSNVVIAMYKKSQKSSIQETDNNNDQTCQSGSKEREPTRTLIPQLSKEHSTASPPTPHPTPRENSTMKKHHLKTELETDKRSGRLMVKISVIDGGNIPSTDEWQSMITKKLTEAGHTTGDRQANLCTGHTTNSAPSDRKDTARKISKASLQDCMSCENVFHEDIPDKHANANENVNRGHMEKTEEINNENRKKKSQRSQVCLTKSEISADSTGLGCTGQGRSVTMRSIINPTGKKKHRKAFDKRGDNESEFLLQLKSLEYDKRNSPVEDLKSSSGFNPNLSPILALTRQHTSYQQIDFDNPQSSFETPVFKYTKLEIPKEFSKHLMRGQFRNNSEETEPTNNEDKRTDLSTSYAKTSGGSLKLKNGLDSSKINLSEDDDCPDSSNNRILHQSYPLDEWKKMVDDGQCGFIVKSFPLDKDPIGKNADVGSSTQSLFLQSRSELNKYTITGIVADQTEAGKTSAAVPSVPASKSARDQTDPETKRSCDVNNNNDSFKSLAHDATFLSPLTTHSFPKPALPSRNTKSEESEVKPRNSDRSLYRPSANLAFVKMDDEKKTSASDNLTFYEILPSINNNPEPKMAKDDLFISGSNTANKNESNGSKKKRPISLDRGAIDDLVRYHNETIPNGFRKHHASISNNSNGINNNNNNSNHSSFLSQHQQQQQQPMTKQCDDTLWLAPYAFGLDKACPDNAPQPASPHQTAKSPTTTNEENDTKRQMQIYAHVRKGICAERQATQILPSLRHILSFNHVP